MKVALWVLVGGAAICSVLALSLSRSVTVEGTTAAIAAEPARAAAR